MSGWIPVYDTMHGIRGEVHVIVKVELFSDFNRFRQSSCGVLFFCCKYIKKLKALMFQVEQFIISIHFAAPAIPQGFYAQIIHGFVEELVVNDDPEYQWIDKIRTPRASNEARQTLFFKLSGEVQRKIGLKALDLGGNAVIGYVCTIVTNLVFFFLYQVLGIFVFFSLAIISVLTWKVNLALLLEELELRSLWFVFLNLPL